jgi:hypothetical protein
LEQAYWSIVWYEARLGGSMRPREVFSEKDVSTHWAAMADFAFSPGQDSVALVDFDGHIRIVQLPSGNFIGEVQGGVYDNEGPTYRVNWIDGHRLIYTRTDGGVGIFRLAELDRTDANLAAGLDGDALVFQRS